MNSILQKLRQGLTENMKSIFLIGYTFSLGYMFKRRIASPMIKQSLKLKYQIDKSLVQY